MIKTNVTRLLDAQYIDYSRLEFSPTVLSAQGVAEAVNLPIEQVYKTLVVLGDDAKPLLVMMRGDRELNLKQLAQVIGAKRLKMATQKEAERLTGLKVGGISPLALLKRNFPTYIDGRSQQCEQLCVSAGARGLNLLLAVEDLVRITGAKLVDLD